MRKYTDFIGQEVDLDDPKTYSYIKGDIHEVRNRIHAEIGYYYCYVNHWHKDWDAKQEERVEALIKRYAEEWRDNINSILWHKEILFLIDDEIENMC